MCSIQIIIIYISIQNSSLNTSEQLLITLFQKCGFLKNDYGILDQWRTKNGKVVAKAVTSFKVPYVPIGLRKYPTGYATRDSSLPFFKSPFNRTWLILWILHQIYIIILQSTYLLCIACSFSRVYFMSIWRYYSMFLFYVDCVLRNKYVQLLTASTINFHEVSLVAFHFII